MSTNEIATAPAATLPITSKVRLFKEVVAERSSRARPIRLVEYVPFYATTHDINIETARQYLTCAEKLEEWAGEHVYLHDLNELFLSAFLRDYSQLVKPATVRSKRTQIMALWRSAADEYLCDPPTRRVRSVKVPWACRDAWTVDEVRQLLREASFMPRKHECGISHAEWFDLAIRIAWDTGIRWGDMVRLRRADIHGNMVVLAQSKTRRPHVGKLSLSTMAAIEQSLERRPRLVVVPWWRSHQTFTKQLRLLVKKAGIRTGTWKWIRRGSATDVELQRPGSGMAARHLGHAPGSKVAEIYYIDHSQVAASIPMVAPRELGK
jgi:integrase